MKFKKERVIVQQHLSYEAMTDLGCFYTPQKFVDKLIEIVQRNIADYKQYTYLDSSCGYGSFLKPLHPLKTIGCDIDPKAIETAKKIYPQSKYYVLNTLNHFTRNSIHLNTNDKLIVIGNPPYNDTTSKVKNSFKQSKPCVIDENIKTRDLGISFLLSFTLLNPDYVAVLHPLSYLIKEANYKLLKPFYHHYNLIDHCIIDSQEFSMTSKTKGFPIIIALYKKTDNGLKYEDILTMDFKTIDNRKFNLKYDNIKNYIAKYPTKSRVYDPNKDILFFTMRDINALNRSQTFIQDYGNNSIIIDKNKFAYYCYVDVFKRYIHKLPYYYGNLDVFINNQEFQKLKDVFITNTLERYPWLKEKNIEYNYNNNYNLIDNYFRNLFANLNTTIILKSAKKEEK